MKGLVSTIAIRPHDFPGVYPDAIRAEVTLETETGPVVKEVSATLIIRDKLDHVIITPDVVRLAQKERIQFQAVGYDKNNILMPDVFFRWSVINPDVGTIDSRGLFTAEGDPGEYPDAVRVEAFQRLEN